MNSSKLLSVSSPLSLPAYFAGLSSSSSSTTPKIFLPSPSSNKRISLSSKKQSPLVVKCGGDGLFLPGYINLDCIKVHCKKITGLSKSLPAKIFVVNPVALDKHDVMDTVKKTLRFMGNQVTEISHVSEITSEKRIIISYLDVHEYTGKIKSIQEMNCGVLNLFVIRKLESFGLPIMFMWEMEENIDLTTVDLEGEDGSVLRIIPEASFYRHEFLLH